MEPFTIGDHAIGSDHSTFVIAEAGSNHNGDLELAKELIDVSADAGADAVKFQTFRAEDLYVPESGRADYLDDDRGIYEIIESMEMPYEWIPELHDYCHKRDIEFLSTPFDERSAAELEPYVPAWKVASYTSSHHPFLRQLAETDKPVIMSTGAHELSEVRESVGVLREHGIADLAVLQCVASYPTPLTDANVRVIRTFAEEFDVATGLSDHTLDPTTAPTAAVALGASVIEKHVTLDRTMDGPDHQFALEPDGLFEMIAAVRDTEVALGSAEKRVLDIEQELHQKARRAVHAVEQIRAGERFTEQNLSILRPGERSPGAAPREYDDIVGKTAIRDIEPGEGVQLTDAEE